VPVRSETLLVVLTVLAVARLTHLVTTDYLTQPFRLWVHRHAPEKVAYLVGCPWCLSLWTAAAVVPVVWLWPRSWWTQIPLLALTASYVTGMAEQLSGLVNAEHEQAEQ